jgi:hypothetical protein
LSRAWLVELVGHRVSGREAGPPGEARHDRGRQRKKARLDWIRCGPWPVQLRFATNLTSAQYVAEQAWLRASLGQCPLHPEGSCGFKRNGTYGRAEPPGARVPRWYCPNGHTTFSLLPDCLAARLPGSLAELEQVVGTVEQAPSLQAAADRLRPDILLPGRLRWVRRRVTLVRAALGALIELMPGLFSGAPTLSAVHVLLQGDPALPLLRQVADAQLSTLPPPLGFGPRDWGCPRRQHHSGPRAPPAQS